MRQSRNRAWEYRQPPLPRPVGARWRQFSLLVLCLKTSRALLAETEEEEAAVGMVEVVVIAVEVTAVCWVIAGIVGIVGIVGVDLVIAGIVVVAAVDVSSCLLSSFALSFCCCCLLLLPVFRTDILEFDPSGVASSPHVFIYLLAPLLG